MVRWVTGERDEGRVWQQQGATPPRAASNQPVSVVSVTLHLSHLSRKDNGRQLKCIAANTNLTLDHSKTVTLDMYCESYLPHSTVYTHLALTLHNHITRHSHFRSYLQLLNYDLILPTEIGEHKCCNNSNHLN